MVVVLAHVGHTIAFLPFFAPPLLITAGLIFLTVRDRLRGHVRSHDS